MGNPPWIRVEWKESGILGDYNPLFMLRKYSASDLATEREQAFSKYPNLEKEWRYELESAEATQNFLNAVQNYPDLKGMQTNLYKCFLPVAWRIGNEKGVTGMLHPEGIYDDPKGGEFRSLVYQKLRYHFQFQNELTIFAEVDHHTKFSVNIYGKKEQVHLDHISNLFSPATIDTCYSHHGELKVPGIKNDENIWNTIGHKSRIIEVNNNVLKLFASLYDEEGTLQLYARLPSIHAKEMIFVLEKFAAYPNRLFDLRNEFYATVMFDETGAQKDGTIKRETRFAEHPEELILSGPHFFVGNPKYKTPRRVCELNCDYDEIDLTDIPDDYLPRTNYVPACSKDEYESRIPRVTWGERKKVTEYYRLVFRGQIGTAAERTLITCLFYPGIAHVHAVKSIALKNQHDLICLAGVTASLLYDFYVKSSGKSGLYASNISFMPLPRNIAGLSVRILALVSITNHYKNLWDRNFSNEFQSGSWTKKNPLLNPDFFKNLTPNWQRNCALRTHYERRQALVETDVLVAQELGITMDELLTIYSIQFPVLRQYENDTWYDQNGRIIFTCSKGLTNTGLKRRGDTETGNPGWEDVKDMKGGTVEQIVIDDTMPGGLREKKIIYVAPFEKCDREEDYRIAWEEFERRK